MSWLRFSNIFQLFTRPYSPTKPTFTRKLGSMLDSQCKALVLKSADSSLSERVRLNCKWHETTDDRGRRVWVLGEIARGSFSAISPFLSINE